MIESLRRKYLRDRCRCERVKYSEETEGEGKKGGEGWQRFFEGRVGLIAGHYLPKLPRRTNIRIKAAPNAPLRLLVQSLVPPSRRTVDAIGPGFRTLRVIIIIINAARDTAFTWYVEYSRGLVLERASSLLLPSFHGSSLSLSLFTFTAHCQRFINPLISRRRDT